MAKEDQKANQGKPETNSHKPGGLKIGFGKVDGNGKRVVRVFNINLRRLAIWALILLLFIPSLLSLFGNFAFKKLEIPLSQAIQDIRDGKVQKVDVSDQELLLYYREPLSEETRGLPNIKSSRKEPTESLSEILNREGIDPQTVEIDVRGGKISGTDWLSIGTNVLFFVGLALFFLWMMRQARGAQDSMFGFGKSNARLFTKGKQNVRFQDVGGLKEAKQEVEEIVDFLKNPKKYQKLGARTPKGVLLIGPSGTGKTLLARAIAGEADVPFYSMAGSEFMEMLVGVGASVTGDTPILVRHKNKTELVEIGKFIDQFYRDKQLSRPIPVSGVQTLGLRPEVNKFWGSRSAQRPVFGGSAWQDVKMVYRHRANEIYEIDYLGGNLRTTGDHSVFIRESGGIRPKEVRNLKPGDLLVNLPMNTRAWDSDKKHTKASHIILDVWQDDPAEIAKYEFAVAQQGIMTQSSIAAEIGVSQMTVSHWQTGVHGPQKLSKKLVKLDLPEKVKVTKELCKLFGYYTAEGRGTSGPEFTFGIDEGKYVEEVAKLMDEVFGLQNPIISRTDDNAVRILYRSKHLGRFFEAQCGAGAHHKHIPDWLWDMPKDYFLAFLESYSNGDGYITKDGKLSAVSVSQRLIRQLAWLCSMHGIKVGIKHEILPAGRIIKNKPLPATESWNLIIGKTSNPFIDSVPHPYQFKRCIVKSVRKRPFDGYVYDLCGVDNEAFFGGEKPILLHNSRVRDLFSTAKAHAPSIIFIDEIDAIGQARGGAFTGGHGEREQTLNQILVEMDGFTPADNVIVCAATNRPDVLDSALVRPGRFDRRVVLDLPDMEERLKILQIHAKNKPFVKGFSWDKVAKRTVGFSGADLENMLNESAILAARRNAVTINMADVDEAATKVKLGPERKRLQSELERKMTAYHEAGHAIVAHFLPRTDPVNRISIVSRGMTLGFTEMMPLSDKVHQTKSELVDKMAAMLGGRAAEELVFNEMTGGASSDIQHVTQVAQRMVVDLGMSDLGPIDFGPQYDVTEYGLRSYDPVNVSDKTQEAIDREVQRFVNTAHKQATEILKRERKALDSVSGALMEHETLDADQFEKKVGKPKAAIITNNYE